MSTKFIDFTDLKNRIRIEDVVAWLGLKMKLEGGTTLRGECPACGGDRRLAVTPNHVRADGTTGSYFCHTDKKGGDMIALVAHVRGVRSMPEAARMIEDHFRTGATDNSAATKPAKQADKREGGFDPEAYAARLDPAHEALQPLSISSETYKIFKAGFAATGVHRGKLALPLHDRDGKLTGHFARSLKGESPLLTFVNGQNPGEHIFAAHLVEAGDLYIASDPLDVLIAYENGERNVVAFLTDGITQQQWEQLSSLMDQKKVERSYLWT
jgi:hypothetical protein